MEDLLDLLMSTTTWPRNFHRIPLCISRGINSVKLEILQTDRVQFNRFQSAPENYSTATYGPWPNAGATIVKLRLPPYWKSSRTDGNYHTVSYLFSNERDPASNPLCMGEGLEQLLASHCSGCKSGLRTAGSCVHRIAGIILLCASSCFDSSKVAESVYLDTARYYI